MFNRRISDADAPPNKICVNQSNKKGKMCRVCMLVKYFL